MTADFTVKQATSGSVLAATLTDSGGNPVNLTGGTVTFVSRAMTATAPSTNLPATIVTAAAGAVSYTLTAADTALASRYMVEWHYTTAAGVAGTWPIDGYQELLVTENLTTAGGSRLVGLGDIKEALRLPAQDRSHDARLLSLLDGLTPVVENLTGPVLQRVCQDETYDGGSTSISLRHRPIISIQEVTEYRGPIAYPLQQVLTPAAGSIYSFMYEAPGRIVRRTAGGGITTFPPGPDAVFVTYLAGYLVTPAHIKTAVTDLVRIHYQIGEQGRHPAFGGAEDSSSNEPGQMILGFFVPNRVREQLAPSRRHPSLV